MLSKSHEDASVTSDVTETNDAQGSRLWTAGQTTPCFRFPYADYCQITAIEIHDVFRKEVASRKTHHILGSLRTHLSSQKRYCITEAYNAMGEG